MIVSFYFGIGRGGGREFGQKTFFFFSSSPTLSPLYACYAGYLLQLLAQHRKGRVKIIAMALLFPEAVVDIWYSM